MAKIPADRSRQTYQEPEPQSATVSKVGSKTAAHKTPAPNEVNEANDTVAFRPTRRPPMAVLQVYDDGRKSAELIRIRQSTFVIGRTEGDLVLCHDPLISGRHAELSRIGQAGHYSWQLRDLGSTNGSFVLVKGVTLKHDMEILISRNRFRFVVPTPRTADAEEEQNVAPANINRTINWQAAPAVDETPSQPYLIELLQTGEGRRFPLAEDTLFVGRDARRCRVALPEDDSLEPCHAKIFRDSQARWQLDDCNSLNGVWLRIHEITLGISSSFLLGEQVFALATL